MGAVTLQAERAHVGEVAFSAAFGNGDDVIGIPESFSAAEIPRGESAGARGTPQAFDVVKLSRAIEAANGADAAVALKNPLPQMARIAAQLPFFDAPLGTEGEAPGRNFELAPAAEATAVRSFGERSAVGSSAGHEALGAHENRIQVECSDSRERPAARAMPVRTTIMVFVRRNRAGVPEQPLGEAH